MTRRLLDGVEDLALPALSAALVLWTVPRAGLGHAATMLVLSALLVAIGEWAYKRRRRRAEATSRRTCRPTGGP